ncbi:MAG: DsrE family protein [Deltaproteobacteria bacterium]|nr:DsrE family protein [Deltaproteobacteria bacterium]
METKRRNLAVLYVVALFLVWSTVSIGSAQEYEAMKGVDNVQAMFDFRDGVPKSALVHMKLLHDTYKQLADMKKNPVFVVVFMGSSVKLISSNQAEFSAEEQKDLKELADTISKMAKDGIDFEVCLFAAHVFKVDPKSIQSEIKHVGNGWISEIGYEARGYSMVPVY